ncbi:hypothetical protein TNCV_20761 [Trichonephila clavipes]|uniref:Uncharacterized protein n=1 Tax=Trichonephila clavipes TaxID=2585209 RepID=A0A8X6R6T4_TRICX|nr:hypothetical protein TNCV_20761 [Trichonephila clavipes]
MSVQRFLKLEEALELLNGLDLDENDIGIAVLPDASELIDEDEGDENEVNTSKIIVKDIPGSLDVRSGDSFHAEQPTSASALTIIHLWEMILENIPPVLIGFKSGKFSRQSSTFI